ncbi:ATP-dependent DNA helicase RecQ [Pullulanibacillus pueri]|uniref:DNA helicase RecQ n=1 Tax=Pullulanibacillus pueri TaxID=1437324 RepID=A0A8J3EJM7_9BACL|nr:DNA helicase RecQ [Pullulanibacillus pueri]MBM7679995.1 ATP-dependent DNA helicase RecQ [Pullulanibacillus pueri]GGH73844.1 ATP-dependent DNA helicase RecQ [Pullulanibacillus pueri]
MEQATTLLKKIFGYDSFREGQKDIISRVLDRQDTVGIMPTGGGKSLCYQIPALLFDGLTFIISPLISLMKDQVDALRNEGVSATFINSSLSQEEVRQRLKMAEEGHYKMIYVAPERFESTSFIDWLKTLPIELMAIDEAHCISQWGHDFRPSYRLIKQMLTQLVHKPVILALTATATPQVTADICQLLEIDRHHVVQTGFARDNLFFQVVKGQDQRRFIREYVMKNQAQSGIIYAATRKRVEQLHSFLKDEGVQVGKYHAGLSEEERAQQQEVFLYDNLNVMVATNAFGMGIDKSNVRYVIHYNMPKNIEAYYQEAGRAGRDGQASECILLYSPQDVQIQKFFIDQSDMEPLYKQREYEKLQQMMGYCHTEMCLQTYILDYFGDHQHSQCGHCGNCLDERENVDITKEAQMILSCVKRMNQRFGKSLVAQVLTGSSSQKIKQFRFNTLSTYGLMADYSQKQVGEFIDYLTAEGYLRATTGSYPVLTLTEQGVDVILGQIKVTKKEALRVKQIIVDNALFDQLRELRKQLSDTEQVPPYMIFSDATLREMSEKLPQTESEFLHIKGVGEQKSARYGEAFLTLIYKYCEENDGEHRQKVKVQEVLGSPHSKKREKSYRLTYEYYQKGHALEEIATLRGLSLLTVQKHLIEAGQKGYDIDWNQYIDPTYIPQLAEAVERLGTEKLKPLKEALPEDIDYFTIQAYLQAMNN